MCSSLGKLIKLSSVHTSRLWPRAPNLVTYGVYPYIFGVDIRAPIKKHAHKCCAIPET